MDRKSFQHTPCFGPRFVCTRLASHPSSPGASGQWETYGRLAAGQAKLAWDLRYLDERKRVRQGVSSQTAVPQRFSRERKRVTTITKEKPPGEPGGYMEREKGFELDRGNLTQARDDTLLSPISAFFSSEFDEGASPTESRRGPPSGREFWPHFGRGQYPVLELIAERERHSAPRPVGAPWY